MGSAFITRQVSLHSPCQCKPDSATTRVVYGVFDLTGSDPSIITISLQSRLSRWCNRSAHFPLPLLHFDYSDDLYPDKRILSRKLRDEYLNGEILLLPETG